jgi:hypothetical protein
MNIIQINSALHRELSYIVTDEVLMEQALKALRQIRRNRRTTLAMERLAKMEGEETMVKKQKEGEITDPMLKAEE